MAQTSTIKEIKNVKPWEGRHGKVYYFSLVTDNGDAGEIGKKSETALKLGDTLTYEIETTSRGNNLKEIKQNGFNGHFGGQGKISAFALSYAKDLMVAQIAAGKTADITTQQLIDATLIVASRFNDWLKQHE